MKIVRNVSLFSLFVLMSSGCSTIKTNELTQEESLALKDKSVVISKYSKLPNFLAQTAINVSFGSFGIASAISSGNEMIRNNNIKDPAYLIAKKLSDGLRSNYNVKVVEPDVSIPKKTRGKVVDLANIYSDYDYVLDVNTLRWGTLYFSMDWDSYRLIYSAHVRLIDVKSKQVIAEERCNYDPVYEDTNDAPSYEELENGDGLRKSLKMSIDYCVDHVQEVAKFATLE